MLYTLFQFAVLLFIIPNVLGLIVLLFAGIVALFENIN